MISFSTLAGYRHIRPLDPTHEGYLDAFIALRDIQITHWTISDRDHPADRDEWRESVADDLRQLRAFVEMDGR